MLFSGAYTRPRNQDLFKLLFGMGVVGMSANQTCFIIGLDMLDNGDIAAVYNCVGPSIMFVMSLSLRLENFTALKLIGVFLGAAGIVFISQLWEVSLSRKNVLAGHLFLLIGIVSSQLFTIIQKFIRGYPDIMIVTVAYWAALCTISMPAMVLTVLGGVQIWPTELF